MKSSSSVERLKVRFLHPDLGIGGAERLVVDAALGLSSKGHHVIIYTTHHDPSHCFKETKDGSLDVAVHGNSLFPRTMLGGKFHALLAYLRCIHCSLVLLWKEANQVDVIIVDQVSICIPFFRCFSSAKILFYGHFPDQLLALKRDSLVRRIYRWPLDWLEEITTGMAHQIVVNSEFTKGVFLAHFTNIFPPASSPCTGSGAKEGGNLKVLYPGIQPSAYEFNVDSRDARLDRSEVISPSITLLSINRFERKKNIALAIKALYHVKLKYSGAVRLVVAGGYDVRVRENVEHLDELQQLAMSLGLETATFAHDSPSNRDYSQAQVLFLPSFSEAQRAQLLSLAQALLYTPSLEHFGIVPLEAMYSRVPVIAVNSGGPLETVEHEATGFLCDPTAESFASAIAKIIAFTPEQHKTMGELGRERVIKLFSLEAFTNNLENILYDLQRSKSAAAASEGMGIKKWIIAAILSIIAVTTAIIYRS